MRETFVVQETIQPEPGAATRVALKCLQCGARLEEQPQQYVCPECGAHWPIINGIPRFFKQDDYYWGEVGRAEARKLLDEARRGSWRAAVRKHFGEGELSVTVLDPQRAAWLALLGLDRTAVAMDIGSGYGAITHSLTASLGTVYSVEAVPERIEFVQERMRQEGFSNVVPIQASATALPFSDGTFDLIVANGILEWIGEWDTEGSVREAQLRFLSALRRLLKDDGVLLIGIENRFSFYLFLGAEDHSGLPYTSLLPRRLATFYLQHSSHQSERMNARKEYRTYTYSARGYRKLLGEAGFGWVSCYWADPGYNRPYVLTPLSESRLVKQRHLEKANYPGPARHFKLRRCVKRAAAHLGLLNWLVADFVLLASRKPVHRTRVQEWLARCMAKEQEAGGEVPPEKIVCSAMTAPFDVKCVLPILQPPSGACHFIAKAESRLANGVSSLRAEVAHLEQVREHLASVPALQVRVPAPVDFWQTGNTLYYLESEAQGLSFYQTVHAPGYFENLDKARQDFTHVVRAGVRLVRVLEGLTEVAPVDSSWHELPEDLRSTTSVRGPIESLRLAASQPRGSRPRWIQHGDFSVENIFLDAARSIEIIDWAHLAADLPPLYDLFTLFVSTLYVDPSRKTIVRMNGEEFRKASFLDLFFSDAGFGRVVGDLLEKACRELSVAPASIPALLVEFLVVRFNFYRSRGAAAATAAHVHQTLLRLCAEQRERRVLGRFPMAEALVARG